MTKGEPNHSVQGSWRGRYFYHGLDGAFGFDAVFLESNGLVDGNILDEGKIGEAAVAGTFVYPMLKFTKTYMSAGHSPVRYVGTMNDEGNWLTGTWIIRVETPLTGTWEAFRAGDGEELKFEEREDEISPETKQEELVATQTS